MLVLARAMIRKAYAPYSRFHVGAVLRAGDGSLHGGCNVENAAYPQGWCAEASAIAAMVGAGQRRIVEALVMGRGARLCTPCGGCRQKLAEFAGPELAVHVCDPRGLRRTLTLGELLPHSFDAANLAKSRKRP
jgi:cytidine deaminase